MIITAQDDGFSLNEPDNFSSFHVDAGGRTSAELTELATAHVSVIPIVDADHLWVSADFLRREGDSDERTGQLERLVEFAREKGWFDEDAQAIRAHVENLGE
ncbi:hypothetical protein [Gulosibacter sp. ACHW.36C]|uniref:Uncharacterized protein n=1 Tax=Gulosibacter sediminis TaxID=1729695 RepID=A0ABY4MZC7_9MICO|nr:hypothetical protein [Gulosibacter sediminis]UQN14573.1 hypothetical protein M3M28_11050 [Gulosibacter sediminis]